MVVVRMMLKSQLAKSLLYIPVSGVSAYAEDFIIIPFYGPSLFYLTPCIPLSFKGEGEVEEEGLRPSMTPC